MLLSIVIPVLNEAEVLPLLLDTLRRTLQSTGWDYEVLFINDGSRDRTSEILAEATLADNRIKALEFSRNFGHQAAVTAGLDFAAGDAVVVMDADLQDPPELIPAMLDLYQQGFDVVSPQRIAREGEGFLKRWTASLFYWMIRRFADERIPSEVGDFRLFSRPSLTAVRALREQHRFMRGLVAWLGLKEAVIPFQRHGRAAGKTKYPFFKMLRFAWTAISSFSALPLRLSVFVGFLLSLFGVAYIVYALFEAYVTKSVVRGWTSLVALQCVFSGSTLIALGLIGDYVARIYEEAKGRPLYVVSKTHNLPNSQPAIQRAVILPVRTAGTTESENASVRAGDNSD